MARPLRIEYEGALYHITARGNERKPLYKEEGDYHRFLNILSELPERFGTAIHGYVLMANHYHLLIETPKANISKSIHYLNATFSGYFNRTYGRSGHLFQGRYKSFLVEKETYLLAISRYIHLNPVRASIVKRPEEYKWSSYPAYAGKAAHKQWLTRNWLLDRFSNDEAEARRLYKAFVNEGLRTMDNPLDDLKAGLVLGSEAFFESIRKKLKTKKHREMPETRHLATRVVGFEDAAREVSRRFGLSIEEITNAGRRNNTARKICLYLLRSYSDMSNEEIARRFNVGYTAVSQATARLRKELKDDGKLRKMVLEIEKTLQTDIL